MHGRRQVGERQRRDRIGKLVEPDFNIRHFRRQPQAQMALRPGFPTRQPALPVLRRHTFLQHHRVAHAANLVGENAVKMQTPTEIGEAKGQRAKGLRHGAGVDHREHRQVETLGEIGRRRLAIKEPHHGFNQDQIVVLRSFKQHFATEIAADEPQIKVVDRAAAGDFEHERIEKIWPALEDFDLATLAAVIARQRGG